MAKKARSGRSREVQLDITIRSGGNGVRPRLQIQSALPPRTLTAPDASGTWHLALALSDKGARIELFTDGAEGPCEVSVAAGARIIARGEIAPGQSLAFWIHPLALRFLATDAPVGWEGRVRLDVERVTGRQARHVPRDGWRGRVLLRQHGPLLSGFLDVGGSRFPLDGAVREADDGTTRLDLRGTGYLTERLTALAMTGTVIGDRFIGGYTGSVLAGGALFCGNALFDDLLCQNPPGQQPQRQDGPAQDPCGKLLWTSEIRRGQFGPDNNRKAFRFRVKRYERCLRIEYLDNADRVIRAAELSEDLNQPLPGGKRVLVYDRAMNDEAMTPPGEGQLRVTGEAKVILVQGCARLKFVQYIRATARVLKADGTADGAPNAEAWALDGGDPYPGTLPLPAGAGNDKGGMADMPGMDVDAVRNASRLAGALLKGKENGARFVYAFEVESFICCDGK